VTFGTDPVGLLCDLIAAPGDAFEPSALPAACRDALALLKRLSAVQASGLPSVVVCAACDDNHPARLDYDPAARCHWHFCPEAGRVDVADESLARLRVDREWLVRWLVAALPIVPDRHKALVPDSVWRLGDAVAGGTGVTAVFAARASTLGDFAVLANALRAIHPAELGLVIAASAAPIPSLSLPNGFHVLDFREIARIESDHLVIGKAKLGRWIASLRRGARRRVKDSPGRPSVANRVKEIHLERRRAGSALATPRAEARAIHAIMKEAGAVGGIPVLRTIERHLKSIHRQGE
jgi:hypothetical protein